MSGKLILIYAGSYQQFTKARMELLKKPGVMISGIRHLTHLNQMRGVKADILFYGSYADKPEAQGILKEVTMNSHLARIDLEDFKILE